MQSLIFDVLDILTFKSDYKYVKKLKMTRWKAKPVK